ncbi:ATP-binding protein [candidate division KSB1 bacterium]
MKIAIASGKGGTGKTTLAVNLSAMLAGYRSDVTYVDCDVEEPDGHLFLHPDITDTETINLMVPAVDESKCNGCGKCGEICNFSAILPLGERVLTFTDLCHGCGGCSLVCPRGAIREVAVEVGDVALGLSNGLRFVQGRIKVGKVQSPLLIRQAKARANGRGLNIIDSPPGTACPAVEALSGCDYIILVAEPTPFGLNDMKLAVGLIRMLGIPYGTVINRHDMGDNRLRQYCRREGVEILLEIPEDRTIAEISAEGDILIDLLPRYAREMEKLVAKLKPKLIK